MIGFCSNRSAPRGLSVLALAAGLSSVAGGQVFEVTLDASEDRWNYPFNLTPGPRPFVSTFGAANLTGFDDYDAQFLVGFDTSGAIPAGLGRDRYRVLSARVRVWAADGDRFRYDPTPDSFATFLPDDDPDFVPDVDAGRSIVAYGTAYRGVRASTGEPWSVETWFESAPFGGVPDVDPAQGSRFAFAAGIDPAGAVIDLSNRLKDRLDPDPIAVGTIPGVDPGDVVPADSEIVFDLEPCLGGGAGFLREGLNAGIVRISIASLHFATGGPGGGTGDPAFPEFYTKENPLSPILGFTPTIELTVRVGALADLTGAGGDGVPDGVVDANDFFFYLGLFASGDPLADLTGGPGGLPDCTIDANDFFAYLSAFSQG